MRAAASASQGFTLIELLVVLGIISILAGISYGGLSRNRGTEGLESVSSLAANLVRQARHTAMSSGAPVELRLSGNEAEGWTISGITQITLHGDQFENHLDTQKAPLGYAGYGWRIDSASGFSLPARPRLLNDPIHDSFLLECQVAAPRGLLREAIDDEADGVTSTIAGPALPEEEQIIYPVALRDNNPNHDGFLAWIQLEAEPSSTLLHATWRARAFAVNVDGTVISSASSQVIAGGSFHRLGLLYRNQRLVLLVNGNPVASVNGSPVPDGLRPVSGDLRIAYGEDYGVDILEAGVIDNVRLYRLGAEATVRLPRNVRPSADDYRVLIYPNGRLSGHTSWSFRWDGPGESVYDSVTMSIHGNGRVSLQKTLPETEDENDDEDQHLGGPFP